MSNYLGAGRQSSSVSITGESQTNVAQSEVIYDKKGINSIQDHDASKEAKEAYNGSTDGRIPLKKDDPLPSSVASRIVGSESLLREVTDKLYVYICYGIRSTHHQSWPHFISPNNSFFMSYSNEGRHLLSEEITLLQEEIGKWYNELNRIDFVAENTPSEEESVIA